MYNDYPYEEEECYKCIESEKLQEKVKYWLKYLIEQLYSHSAFDAQECERCLEELCVQVEVKIPSEEIAIQRKTSPVSISDNKHKSFDLKCWKEWNSSYLKNLMTQ